VTLALVRPELTADWLRVRYSETLCRQKREGYLHPASKGWEVAHGLHDRTGWSRPQPGAQASLSAGLLGLNSSVHISLLYAITCLLEQSVIDEYRRLWAVVELASRPGRCF
jgi:hypothetical protein